MQNLVNLAKNTNQGMLPVVYIGQYQEAKLLLKDAELANSDAQRIIWVMSDGVGTSHEIFGNTPGFVPNVLSVSPAYHEVKEFKEDWIKKLNQFIQNPALQDDWVYKKYIEKVLQCSFEIQTGRKLCTSMTQSDLNTHYHLFAHVSMSIDAAYIIAKALKRMHSNLCRGKSIGICQLMKEQMPQHFYKYVRNTTFTYNLDTFPYSPESLDGKKVQTQSNTNDPEVSDKNNPLYFVHNYKCFPDHTMCTFEKVSSF